MNLAVIFFTFSAILISGCYKEKHFSEPGEKPNQQKIILSEKGKALVEADNAFGIKLFKQLNGQAGDNGNIIISPLSISTALGMTYNGASGETKAAMGNTLELQGLSVKEINEGYKNLIDALTTVDPKVTLSIPNSIWYRQEFTVLQEFISLNQKYFNAKVTPLNFADPASVVTVNNWVAQSTNGKISSIIDRISGTDIMFLINAVYFNGTWIYEFDKQNTLPKPFYLSEGTSKEADMMHLNGTLDFASNELFKAVDIGYGSGNFSMVIMLPREDLSPEDIISVMNPEIWAGWMNSFSKQNINLSLPKFKLEYEELLNDVLKKLGMGIALESGADFSNINPFEPLSISFVKHKTFIDVNEEGTEAAAVTVVGIEVTSIGGDTPYVFNVNRPFVFAIRERDTGAIIFLGKVNEP
jgi:serine protease inhibitor